MKILLITDYSTPIGGAERNTVTLRDGLRERGHEARIFSTIPLTEGHGFADYECFGTVGRARTLLQSANPWAYTELRRALSDFRPDVVHVRMYLTQLSPMILPLLRSVPSLYHVVWLRAVCPVATKILPDGSSCSVPWGWPCWRNSCLPLRDFAPLMLQMHLARHWRDVFQRVVANSEAVRAELMTGGFEQVEVVWNGVPVVPQRPPLRDPPTIAFAGRLVAQKGCDILIRSLARLPNPSTRLLIAGDGPERCALERLVIAERLEGRVDFLGHLGSSELEQVLAPAWVQAVPSRYAEGFGLVAAEAMMRGTAVVGSDCGGLAELLERCPSGFPVAPGRVQALGTGLAPLLEDREKADLWGREARRFALKELAQERCVSRFLEIYSAMLHVEE